MGGSDELLIQVKKLSATLRVVHGLSCIGGNSILH